MLHSRFKFGCKIIKKSMYFITSENALNMNKKKVASSNLEGEVRWLAVALHVIEERRTISSNAVCLSNEVKGKKR